MGKTITLMEAVQLAAQYSEELRSLRRERHAKSLICFGKGDKYEKSSDVDELTERINKMTDAVAYLKNAIARHGQLHKVDYTDPAGREYSLGEAVIRVKLMREELDQLKVLATMQDRPQIDRYSRDTYTVPSFDVEKYKVLAHHLAKEANKLSTAIDKANFSIEIEFDPDSYGI